MFRLLLFTLILTLLSGCTTYIEPEFIRQQNETDEYNTTLQKLKSCSEVLTSKETIVVQLEDSIHNDNVLGLEIAGKPVEDKGLNIIMMYIEYYLDVNNKNVVLQTRFNYGDSAIYYFLTYNHDYCSLESIVRVIK